MSKAYFIAKIILILFTANAMASAVAVSGEKKPLVITSDTLMADNKTNTAVFEGSVTAKTDDIVMHSDKMTVFYDNSEGKVSKIYAAGNVKVHKKERVIFSNEATYLDEEGKITFTGEPRAVEGENIITGTQIIYYLKDDRSVVESSKVFMKSSQQTKK